MMIFADKMVAYDTGMVNKRFKLPDSLSLIILLAKGKAIKNMANIDQAGTLC